VAAMVLSNQTKLKLFVENFQTSYLYTLVPTCKVASDVFICFFFFLNWPIRNKNACCNHIFFTDQNEKTNFIDDILHIIPANLGSIQPSSLRVEDDMLNVYR
jgi:hypothetical protein